MKRTTLALVVLSLAHGCAQNRDFEGAGDPETESSTGGATTDLQTSSGAATSTGSSGPLTATTSATTSATTAAEASSGSGSGSSTAADDCTDLDLGTTIGQNIITGTTVGRGNDYTTMSCGVAGDGGGFVGPDRSDQEDFVISWTFPSTGSYVVKSAADAELDVVIGVAAASCDASVDSCDDECFDAETALVLSGREGEQVHLIVEGFSEAGEFSLSIFEGDDPQCESGGSSSTGE